jgi:protein arginine N-methyltransferase 7
MEDGIDNDDDDDDDGGETRSNDNNDNNDNDNNDNNGGNMGAPDDFEDPADAAEDERKTRARLTIIRLRDELFAADPGFKRKTCAALNAEAVAHLKNGDDLRCVAAFAKLFRKVRDNHLVHKELYVCHSNRAAAYLNLGLFEEALWDARRCQELAEERYSKDRDHVAVSTFCKAYARKGFALMVGLLLTKE